MSDLVNLSRRDFLSGTVLAGGGLVLGCLLPRQGSADDLLLAGEEVPLGPWLRLAPDGSVTVLIEKAEMGQGVSSSLPALVAEELEVPWQSVRFASPIFRGPLPKIYTGVSSSVRTSWVPLRRAGAAAREMLIEAAARSWHVDADACRAIDGRVHHVASGRSLAYAELADLAAALPVPQAVALKPDAELRLIGQSLPRLDIPSKVAGSARYGIDVRLEGMRYGVPVQSPVFGGALTGANREAALAVAGVSHVAEIPNGLVVVADHYWQARKGLAALEPRFSGGDESMNSTDYRKRLLAALETPGVEAYDSGEAQAALRAAPHVIEARYSAPFLTHATMEPMNATARMRDGECEVWAPSQSPSQVCNAVADALEIPPNRVSVHITLMGGSFGRRYETDFAVQAALAARTAGVPVQVIWSREEDIQHGFYRPGCAAHLSAVVGPNGEPTALRSHVAGPWKGRKLPGWLRRPIGALEKELESDLVPGFAEEIVGDRIPALLHSGVSTLVVRRKPPVPYLIAQQRAEFSMVDTEVPIGWWRATSHSQNVFFSESFIDELAIAAGRDPLDYRRAMLSGRERRVLERVAERAGWGSAIGAGRGRGISFFSGMESLVAQVAEVTLLEDGAFSVDRVFCAIDCGPVVSPDGVRSQLEGSIVFGLSAALYGELSFEAGRVRESNFHDYKIVDLAECPEIEVEIVPSDGPIGGAGEPGTPGVAPAVANAIVAAGGPRLRDLPLLLRPTRSA